MFVGRKMLPSEVLAKKAELMKHVQEMKTERKVAMALHRESLGRSNWQFEYDDKCGSQSSAICLARQVAAVVMADGITRWGSRLTSLSVH